MAAGGTLETTDSVLVLFRRSVTCLSLSFVHVLSLYCCVCIVGVCVCACDVVVVCVIIIIPKSPDLLIFVLF